MYRSLKERGRAASEFYAGRSDYFYLTPTSLSLLRGLEPVVKDFCRGRVLDAGAGRGAYKSLLSGYAEDYVGMDVSTSSATDAVGDAQSLPFATDSFDTVFCSQVLEHIPDPQRALNEFFRVLKPGGHLLLTVPHLSWLHNEPHDYYRYTSHGLKFLLERAGFDVKKNVSAGGLVSLLGHIPSTVLMNMTFGIPVLHPQIRRANRLWGKLVVWVDTVVERKKLFALNFIAVSVKRQNK